MSGSSRGVQLYYNHNFLESINSAGSVHDDRIHSYANQTLETGIFSSRAESLEACRNKPNEATWILKHQDNPHM